MHADYSACTTFLCPASPTSALGRFARFGTHVSPRLFLVSVIGVRLSLSFRPDCACSATRGLGANPRIEPYALPGSDSPAGTARQSIELEESATPGHLLQPGRVVFERGPFLAAPGTRPKSVSREGVALVSQSVGYRTNFTPSLLRAEHSHPGECSFTQHSLPHARAQKCGAGAIASVWIRYRIGSPAFCRCARSAAGRMAMLHPHRVTSRVSARSRFSRTRSSRMTCSVLRPLR